MQTAALQHTQIAFYPVLTVLGESNTKQTVGMDNMLFWTIEGCGWLHEWCWVFFFLMRASLVSATGLIWRESWFEKADKVKTILCKIQMTGNREEGRFHYKYIYKYKFKIQNAKGWKERGGGEWSEQLINLSLTGNSFRETFAIHPSLSHRSSSPSPSLSWSLEDQPTCWLRGLKLWLT